MYRIRLHGRGGQGIKTASRILGSALFAEGYEVQDAPRYGAERRGAPIFAYVRAARRPIHERGVIGRPDLVVVADDTLVNIPAAGVTAGCDAHTLLLLATDEAPEVWRERLQLRGPIRTLPPDAGGEPGTLGVACAAVAARLVGCIGWEALDGALARELAALGAPVVEANRRRAREAWDAFEAEAGTVPEGPDRAVALEERPDWIELPFEAARIAAPDIHGAATSVQVRTGLWRTVRPVIDYERCHHCVWLCSTLCPDSAILVDEEGAPRIDLDHCKGCMICVAVCPTHAIETVLERDARDAAEEEARP